MRPAAPRPPRLAGSPSSSISSGSSGSFHRKRERSPRTPLPPPVPLHAPGPMYPVPRTPMADERQYQGTIDSAADLEGDPDEPYHEDIVYHAGYEAYHSDSSYGSERESVNVSSAPSSRHSSDDFSASGPIGYGEASSGSASDYASDDDLVNRHFAEIFP
ncbi:hypothetical protein PIB30_024715 [Stylosanthes scabra]|uniref:Uncharacterized protein n=1 Tax=Stylosanthes scabra TaxID=79078 RepID=A0ABU6RAF9_9FABA|nr:hypothetical protein [Stylosanthes scabra]